MDNRHEIVEEVETVVLYPASETGDVDTLNLFKHGQKYAPDDPSVEIKCGHVYVMNENGKTIATYHLFPSKPLFEPFTPEQEAIFLETLNEGESRAIGNGKLVYNNAKTVAPPPPAPNPETNHPLKTNRHPQPDTGEPGKKIVV